MRLINAEPIMKFIQDGLNEKDPQKHIGYDGIRIMTEIEYAPTVQSAPVWTPCSDGLPESEPYYTKAEKLYLVNYTWGDDTIRTAIASYRGVRHHEPKDTVWYDEIRKEDMIQNMSGSGRTVIAWQPLPDQFRDTTKKVDHIVDTNKKVQELPTTEKVKVCQMFGLMDERPRTSNETAISLAKER